MDPVVGQILGNVAVAVISAATTLLTTKSVKKQATKHSSRSDILQLILEDRVGVKEGKLPENYQAILDSYDEYRSAGGNSYIHEKVEDYKKWYAEINKRKDKNAKRN